MQHLQQLQDNGIYMGQESEKTTDLSDLALANVEALAQGEGGTTTVECCAALWGECKEGVKAPYVKCTFN